MGSKQKRQLAALRTRIKGAEMRKDNAERLAAIAVENRQRSDRIAAEALAKIIGCVVRRQDEMMAFEFRVSRYELEALRSIASRADIICHVAANAVRKFIELQDATPSAPPE
jgi:hypothetical protein